MEEVSQIKFEIRFPYGTKQNLAKANKLVQELKNILAREYFDNYHLEIDMAWTEK